MSKLLTVFGATGTQGGSVIKTVLGHPQLSKQFRIRAITRDPSKPSGKALSGQGVDVVRADMSDKSSLAAALKGSNAVFAVTNYWESSSKEIEVEQGRAIADVAAELGVEHLIWSTLPNVTKLSNGALPNVEHFDGKAEVEEYIRGLNVPMTSFVPGFYMSNLKSMMSKDEDGSYTLAWPVPASTKFPLFSASTDTGKFVASILLHREQLLNDNVFGASGWWSGQEIVDTFKHVTGKTAQYVELPADVWKGFLPNEKVAQEMLENFFLIRDYKYFGGDAEQNLTKAIELLEEAPHSLKEYFGSEQW